MERSLLLNSIPFESDLLESSSDIKSKPISDLVLKNKWVKLFFFIWYVIGVLPARDLARLSDRSTWMLRVFQVIRFVSFLLLLSALITGIISLFFSDRSISAVQHDSDIFLKSGPENWCIDACECMSSNGTVRWVSIAIWSVAMLLGVVTYLVGSVRYILSDRLATSISRLNTQTAIEMFRNHVLGLFGVSFVLVSVLMGIGVLFATNITFANITLVIILWAIMIFFGALSVALLDSFFLSVHVLERELSDFATYLKDDWLPSMHTSKVTFEKLEKQLIGKHYQIIKNIEDTSEVWLYPMTIVLAMCVVVIIFSFSAFYFTAAFMQLIPLFLIIPFTFAVLYVMSYVFSANQNVALKAAGIRAMLHNVPENNIKLVVKSYTRFLQYLNVVPKYWNFWVFIDVSYITTLATIMTSVFLVVFPSLVIRFQPCLVDSPCPGGSDS